MAPPKLRLRVYLFLFLVALIGLSALMNLLDASPRLSNTRSVSFQTNYGFLEGNISETEFRSSLVLSAIETQKIVAWGPREPIDSVSGDLRINISRIEAPLEIIQTLKLPSGHYLYLFDLVDDSRGQILASVVVEDSNGCVEFKIIKWQSIEYEGKTAWASKLPCIRLTGKSVGWHDFQGKLAMLSDSQVLLTTGLLVADTKLDAYPNSGLDTPDFSSIFDLMDFYNFFGMVHLVDLDSNSAEIISKGLRGPSGVVAFGQGKFIFIADHGPRGGDEFNLLRITSSPTVNMQIPNFGWPQSTYGLSYNYPLPPALSQHSVPFNTKFPDLEEPLYVWSPSVAPQNLIDGQGLGRPELFDQLILMGSLKAESLFFIDVSDLGVVRAIEQVEIGSRIRDMERLDNSLLLATDSGEILFLKWEPLGPDSMGQYPPINQKDVNYWFDQLRFLLKSITSWAFFQR